MKIIIAGSRSITDLKAVIKAVEASGYNITEVISGEARGVDKLGEDFAALRGLPVKKFPAEWNHSGWFDRTAGHKRNKQMAEYAKEHNGALIAIWDGKSKGTKNMINWATELKLKKFIYQV